MSALKVYLKPNQKIVRITFSTYDKPSLKMQKNWVKLSYSTSKLSGHNLSNFWVANLENW
jgi:hypothetical protein